MPKCQYTEEEFKAAVASSSNIHQTMQKLNVASQGAAYTSFHRAVKRWSIDTSHFSQPATRQAHKEVTLEELKEAAAKCFSIAAMIRELGLTTNSGSSHKRIQKLIIEYNIDTSHFTGQGWSKNKPPCYMFPVEEYLNNERAIGSHSLKLRLLKEGILPAQCSKCKLETWLDGPIPLELDHIDGNKHDNSLSNLRILCPNCHALTPTYCSKNKNNQFRFAARKVPTVTENSITQNRRANTCIDCGTEILDRSTRCKLCAKEAQRKTEYPPIFELLAEVKATNYTAVAKRLGVTDNAVRKYIRRQGVEVPRKQISTPQK